MTLNDQNCLSCVAGDVFHRLWSLLAWLQQLMPALCLYESYGTEGNIWTEIICIWFITKKNVVLCLYLVQSTFVSLRMLVADKSHLNNHGFSLSSKKNWLFKCSQSSDQKCFRRSMFLQCGILIKILQLLFN